MPVEEITHDFDAASLPDLLPIYYKRLFPYGPYFKWLNYGGGMHSAVLSRSQLKNDTLCKLLAPKLNIDEECLPKNYFANREFSFTLKDDVYIRYQSFSDQQELEKEIQKRCPYKIDIGAIFTHKPKDHKTVKAAAFQAQEKELVFDIDMTDYDDVRFCCSGADICSKCWPLMQIAIKIIDRSLREDFGFQHLFWVYSGRRGVHCWVCDETARRLSQTGRSAIAEYLSIVKGGENQTKKVTLESPIHPSIRYFKNRKAIEIIDQRFVGYAVDKQDFLGDEEKQNKVMALVTDESFKEMWEKKDVFSRFETTKLKWEALYKKTEESQKYFKEEVMLQYCYPRLDVNVSKGVNHLLKSPFCIHPKTGRVCVPIDPENIDSFDPFKVPTISAIIEELNTTESKDEESKKIKDYRKTSLSSSIAIFEKFLKGIENTWKGKKIEESDKKMEF